MAKKILIINSSAFTIGDVAISDCMIDQILKIIPDAQITIESGNAQVHRGYVEDKNINIVQRLFDTRNIAYSRSYLSFSFLKNNFKIIFQYFFDAFDLLVFSLIGKSFTNREIFDAIKKADIIVSAGGDAITKNYGFFLRLYMFSLLKLMDKKIVVYASTIGPFSGISKFFVRKSLQKLDLVMPRDKKSYDFLIESGLSSDIVKRTADCVILLEQKSTSKTEEVVRDLNITNQSVGIFLKTNAFSDVLNDQYNKYLEKITEIAHRLNDLNHNVVFFSANDTDYDTTKKFLDSFKLNYPIVNIMDFKSYEAKEVLSKMGLVITSRMHPAILASTAGVPVIGISDESKMPEYLKIIKIPDFYLKQSDFEIEPTMDLIARVFRDRSVASDLNGALDDARKMAGKNMEYLEELINNEYGK